MNAEIKKGLIYSGIFLSVVIVIFVIANLVSHLTKRNNHDERRYGVYRIRMVDWNGSSDQRYINWARQTLPELNRLGPTFQLVDSGENITVVRSDVVNSSSQCNERTSIAYQIDLVRNTRRIIIDPICVVGEYQFKTAFMHEIGHSLGMNHVCRQSDNRNDCSSVGRGIAVMNPNLVYEGNNASPNGEEHVDMNSLPTYELQDLDFREFCRVRGCGN